MTPIGLFLFQVITRPKIWNRQEGRRCFAPSVAVLPARQFGLSFRRKTSPTPDSARDPARRRGRVLGRQAARGRDFASERVQQQREAGHVDRLGEFALLLAHCRDPRRHDLAALGNVALQQPHVLVVDLRCVGAGGGQVLRRRWRRTPGGRDTLMLAPPFLCTPFNAFARTARATITAGRRRHRLRGRRSCAGRSHGRRSALNRSPRRGRGRRSRRGHRDRRGRASAGVATLHARRP